MCTRIILLECLVWMPVEIWYILVCQDLITIASSRYTLSSAWTKILDDNRTKFWIQAITAPRISFYHTVVVIALTLPSPNSCSFIGRWIAISAFIGEGNIPPLLISTVLPVNGPLETCLTVSLCKDRTSVGTTTSEVVSSQPTTYCIITDGSLMRFDGMSCCFRHSWKSIRSNAGGVCTVSVLALLPVVYHYADCHLCCWLHCNADVNVQLS